MYLNVFMSIDKYIRILDREGKADIPYQCHTALQTSLMQLENKLLVHKQWACISIFSPQDGQTESPWPKNQCKTVSSTVRFQTQAYPPCTHLPTFKPRLMQYKLLTYQQCAGQRKSKFVQTDFQVYDWCNFLYLIQFFLFSCIWYQLTLRWNSV